MSLFEGINWVRVGIAAVACWVLGGVWYSPLLFAKPWVRAMGWDPDDKAKMDELKKGRAIPLVLALVTAAVSAAMLSRLFGSLFVVEWQQGLKIAFGVWLGFVATVQLTGTLFGKKKITAFFIDAAYQLACFMATAGILTY